eukprot:m.69216 g.69216  ORF g.69216 m.69216 type:complete len:357 (-) comp14108_c0_seq2:1057-2127(-)
MADHPPGPPQPDPASASLNTHNIDHNSLHPDLPDSTAMMAADSPPSFSPQPRNSQRGKQDTTRHRCDIAFCRQRRPNMRKVKKPKSEKQMERYHQIWTQIGGYPEGVNEIGKLVTQKAQFYFCPDHIKPRGEGGVYRAYTVEDFLPRVLSENGDPVWRGISAAARAKFRGSKSRPEPVANTAVMMEPQALSLPMIQQVQHQSMLSNMMAEPRGGPMHPHNPNASTGNTPSEQHVHHVRLPEGPSEQEQHHLHMQPMPVQQLYTPQSAVRMDAFVEQANALRHRLNLPASVPDEVVERIHALSSGCAEAMRTKARVEADNRQLMAQLQMKEQEVEHYKQLSNSLGQGMGNPGAAPSS